MLQGYLDPSAFLDILSFSDKSIITKNIKELLSKLSKSTDNLYLELHKNLRNINFESLTWKDKLANQIISNDSKIVEELSIPQKEQFGKPIKKMYINNLSDSIQNQCSNFIINYEEKSANSLVYKFIYDGK